MSTHSAKISPCGRFVVATGFSPDVKVMEVCFAKSGEFKQVTKAYELSGHTSGIYDVAFDVDTSHIATISKDGTWKLYHTKSEYLTFDACSCYLSDGPYCAVRQPNVACSAIRLRAVSVVVFAGSSCGRRYAGDACADSFHYNLVFFFSMFHQSLDRIFYIHIRLCSFIAPHPLDIAARTFMSNNISRVVFFLLY